MKPTYGAFLDGLEVLAVAELRALETKMGRAEAARTTTPYAGQRDRFEDTIDDLRQQRHLLSFAVRAIRERRRQWQREMMAR